MASGLQRAGADQLHLELLGNHAVRVRDHHLHGPPRTLFLDQPPVATERHLVRHPQQLHRFGLKNAVVVIVVGPHLEREREPVIRLHVRQDVERGDLRAEKLERRPVLFLLELLPDRIGIGQNLQTLLFTRGELGAAPDR